MGSLGVGHDWATSLSLFTFKHWRRQWHPIQHSCLENPMGGGAWWAAVHGVARSWTRLSDFPFTFHFHSLEKEMETHSNVLAWKIPGTVAPGWLLSMGSHRVRHNWGNLAVLFFPNYFTKKTLDIILNFIISALTKDKHLRFIEKLRLVKFVLALVTSR